MPSLSLLGEFRRYALVSFILSVTIYFLYQRFRTLKNPVAIFVLMIVLFGLYYTFFMDLRLPYLNMSLRNVLNYRNYFLADAAGGSQMFINLDHPSFIVFLLNYLHSYVGNLIGPLPWHIKGFSTLFVFFTETIFFALILNFLWKKRKTFSSVESYVLLHAFVWISLIAVSNDNIGTATRLRPVGWILIIIVFASVFCKHRSQKKRISPF